MMRNDEAPKKESDRAWLDHIPDDLKFDDAKARREAARTELNSRVVFAMICTVVGAAGIMAVFTVADVVLRVLCLVGGVFFLTLAFRLFTGREHLD